MNNRLSTTQPAPRRLHPLAAPGLARWLVVLAALVAGAGAGAGAGAVEDLAGDAASNTDTAVRQGPPGSAYTLPDGWVERFEQHGVTYTALPAVPYPIKDVEIQDVGDLAIILPTLSRLYGLSAQDTLRVADKVSHPDADHYRIYLWVGDAQVRMPLTLIVSAATRRILQIQGALPLTATLDLSHPDDRHTALRKVMHFKQNPPPDSPYAKTPFLTPEQSRLKSRGKHRVSKTVIPGRHRVLEILWSVGLELQHPIALTEDTLADGSSALTHEWFLVDAQGKVRQDVVIVTVH